MFRGNYNFFDYKYNIVGYNGEDFGSVMQYVYLFASIVLVIVLLILFHKASKKKIKNIIRFTGIFMIIFYILKTSWESFYDIKMFGAFNTGLLPLDACSIVMYATILAGYGKGTLKKMGESWLVTGGIVGGVSTLLYLNAFKYYPFFSFGAFYSMIWHFLMIFIGLLLITSHYIEFKYQHVLWGYFFHVVISLIVIPINFIFDFDFMLYHHLGGIPIFEDIATTLSNMNLTFLNPLLMLLLYFVAFNIVYIIYLVIKALFRKNA